MFREIVFLHGQAVVVSWPRKFFHISPTGVDRERNKTGSGGVRLLFMSVQKREKRSMLYAIQYYT